MNRVFLSKINIHDSSEAIVPALYIVSTPIGNLKDITMRALETLNDVHEIYCEDKRVSKKLLDYYNIKKTLYIYNDHSDEVTRSEIIDKIIDSHKSIALICDAGTPLINDPGYKLVREAIARGVSINVIPGVSSIITALTGSGCPSDQFTFAGFVPKTIKTQIKFFYNTISPNQSLIYLLSLSQVRNALTSLAEIMPNEEITLAKELTKKFEQFFRGRPTNILAEIETDNKLHGEFVLIIPPVDLNRNLSHSDITDELDLLLSQYSSKDASQILSLKLGIPKNEIYKLAISRKKSK